MSQTRFRYSFWTFLAEPFTRKNGASTFGERMRIFLYAITFVSTVNWAIGRKPDDWMALPTYGSVFVLWYLINRHYKKTEEKEAGKA